MKESARIFTGLVGALLGSGHLCWVCAQPSWCSDFNSGYLPPGGTLYGSADIDTAGGVGNSGVLILTLPVNYQQGSLVAESPVGATPVSEFTISFWAYIGSGTIGQADGMSVNFAADLPNSSFGEEGAGSGLSVCFDTYDNGCGEAPAIDVKWQGAIVGSVHPTPVEAGFVPIYIALHADGTVDVYWAGSAIFVGLPTGYFPIAGRFGFGARTGGENEKHYIDDLCIGVVPANSPPRISEIPDQTIVQDGTTGRVPFRVWDAETPADSLTVRAGADNTVLVPRRNIEGGGTGSGRWVAVTPAAGQSGQTTITVTVTDACGNSASCTQMITVNDTTAPVLLGCPASPLSFQRYSEVPPPANVTARDFCDGALTPSFTERQTNPGSSVDNVITRIWIVIDACGNAASCTQVMTVNDTINDPPTITSIRDQTILEDTSTGPLSFMVDDQETPAANLIVTAASSDPALVPLSGISFGGRGANRTVTVTPAANQSGVSQITVTVSDGQATASTSFEVTVTPLVSPVCCEGKIWLRQQAEGPTPRRGHVMAYDTARDRVVLFGGFDGAWRSDTWLWNGTAWTRMDAREPPVRSAAAMAYDEVRETLVLFGGSRPGGMLGDTWEWNGSARVLLRVEGPAPREGHAMAFDSQRRRIVLFGGRISNAAGSESNDTWEFDGQAWKRAAPTTSPPACGGHGMAWDGEQVLLFGGLGSSGELAESWRFDGKTWVQVRGPSPLAADMPALAYDTWARSPDPEPPRILSIDATCRDARLCVTFDRPVDPASALRASLYTVDGGLTVRSAQAGDQPNVVCLELSAALAPGTKYLLTAHDLNSLCGSGKGTSERVFTCNPCSQGSAGEEFWITFPSNHPRECSDAAPPVLQLFIAGPDGASGTVSIPGGISGFSRSFGISGGQAAVVPLPDEAQLNEAAEGIFPCAIPIQASTHVTVYGYNHLPCSTDGYLALPVNGLGTDYSILGYPDVFRNVRQLSGEQLAVVATQDQTEVIVTPSVQVNAHPANQAFPVSLNQGDVYQLVKTDPVPADLAGTLITANYPVAVFSSHRCANVPDSTVFFCNHLVEQLPPTELWGTEFIVQPFAGRLNGDIVRLLSKTSGTVVHFDGVAAGGPIGPGQSLRERISQPTRITATEPILVAQYACSADFDNARAGDPFMVLVPPVSLYAAS